MNSSNLSPDLHPTRSSVPFGQPLSTSTSSCSTDLVPKSPTIADEKKLLKPEVLLKIDQQHADSLTDLSLVNTYASEEVKAFNVTSAALKYICLGSSSFKILEPGWYESAAYPYYMKLFTLYDRAEGLFTKGQFPKYLLPVCKQLISHYTRLAECELEYDDDLKVFADEIAHSIIALAPGHSYVMSASYNARPAGHSVIVRFKKEAASNKYSIFVYSANNIEKWGIEKNEDHKVLINPYLKFENVTQEELFFTSDPSKSIDSIIFLNILKLQQPTERGDINFRSLMALFMPFRHRQISSDRLPQLFITRQRGTNCITKTLNCLLLDLVPGRNLYKRLTLDNRFYTLLFYGLTHREQLQTNPTDAFRFRQGAMNFLRSTYKHAQQGVIKVEDYYKAVATLRDLLKPLLSKDNKPVTQTRGAFIAKSQQEYDVDQLACKNLLVPLFPIFPKADPSSALVPTIDPRIGQNADWATINFRTLGNVLDKAWKDEDLVFRIEFLMQNLRKLRHTAIPGSLDQRWAQTTLDNLWQIACKYTFAVSRIKNFQSCASQNCIMEILAIAYRLAVKCDADRAILARFGIYYEYFERQASLFMYAMQDPTQLEHRNELMAFYQDLPSKWRLFNYEDEPYQYARFCRGEIAESQLFQLYMPDITQSARMEYYIDIHKFGCYHPHIGALASIAALATSLFKFNAIPLEGATKPNYPTRLIRTSGLIEYMCGFFYWKTDNQDKDYAQEYGDLRSPRNPEGTPSQSLGLLHSSTLWVHEPTDLIDENRWQTLSAHDQEEKRRIAFGSLCEPRVEVSALFDTWSEQVEALSDPEWRPLLENLFFKTITENNRTISPLINHIEQDPYFCLRITKLTDESFRTIKHLPFKLEHFQAFLGFLAVCRLRSSLMYLAKRIKNLDPSTNESQVQRKELLQWIERFLSSSSCAGDIKTELLLVKTVLLLECPIKVMQTSERVELALAYSTVKPLLGSSQHGESPVFRREIQRRWLELVPEWEEVFNRQTDKEQFFVELKSTMDGVVTQAPSDVPPRQLGIKPGCAQLGHWWFNYARAEIGNALGRWNPDQIDFPQTDSTRRLFSDRRHRLKAFGQRVTFVDAIWGEVEIDASTQLIQRRFKEKWYVYIHAVNTLIPLNAALVKDHALWRCEDGSHVLLCDLKSGEPCYIINKIGRVLTINGSETYVNLKQSQALLREFRVFEEHPQSSAFFSNVQGWSVQFPRFKTPLGRVLRFVLHQEKRLWCFSDNPNFFIDQNPIMECRFDRCLHLVNAEKTKRLVIVAKGEITAKSYDPTCTITLPPTDQEGHKGALTYYEYEMIGEQLVSRSFSGQLYLASLSLACKQYQEAFAIVKGISLSETIDKVSENLFIDLLSSSIPFNDHSPNASAVILHAYSLFLNIDPYAPVLQAKKVIEAGQEVYTRYLRSLANVELPLLLSQEEELAVILSLKSDLFRERKKQLSGESYRDRSYAAMFEAPNLLKICNGFFPHQITHVYTEQEFIHKFRELRKEKDLNERLNELYSYKASDFRWKRIIYRLATQTEYSSVDRWILFFAHVYQVLGKKVEVPPMNATDDEVRLWAKQISDSFKRARSSKDCFDQDGHVAMEWKSEVLDYVCSSEEMPALPPLSGPSLLQIALPQLDNTEVSAPLASIRSAYLRPTPSTGDENDDNEVMADSFVGMDDPIYGKSIQNTLTFYRKDRQIARSKQIRQPLFIEGATHQLLSDQLKAMVKELEESEKQLIQKIVALANIQPAEQQHLANHCAQVIGHALKKNGVQCVCRKAVHTHWKDLFQKMNPCLKGDDLDELRRAAIAYMRTQTERMQLKKIIEPLDTFLTSGDRFEEQQAAEELARVRAYDPQKDLFPLHFEYTTGLRLRTQQAQLIRRALPLLSNHPHVQGVAFQAMMNSGKSSVIVSALMELASESGYVACVFSHYSQFSSMRGLLQRFQRVRFDKDLLSLPFQLKDLGDSKILEIIRKRLLEAKRKRCGVIMKSNFPQIVQLKFILECFRLKDASQADAEKKLDYLKELAEILVLFEKDIVSFIDECDLILHLMTEVNVPLGESKAIPHERVDLVSEIYLILLDPEIREKTRLRKDQQKDAREVLPRDILPFVADRLFLYPALALKDVAHLKGAFKRHLLEAISYADQQLADDHRVTLDSLSDLTQRENVELLRLMESRNQSQDRYEKESAEAFGLARRIFLAVLPKAFSKSNNRNYGPLNRKHSTGEIIPYQGPDAPAKTRFGNVYLSLAAHLQAAIGGGIAEDELRFLAGKMMVAAQSYANQEKIALPETAEAKQFLELTGVALCEISSPGKLKEAHAYVNHPDHPERRLKIRKEVAPFHVKYYPQYVRCNPINLVEHLARPFACSGTRWNSPSFHPKVGELSPDAGTEGAIIDAIEARDTLNSTVHGMSEASLPALIEVIRNHPQKRRIRSIIDGGGFLKDCKRATTQAEMKKGSIQPHVLDLLDFFKKEPGTSIKGVVYLHRYSEDEVSEGNPEEVFVVAKQGEWLPFRLDDCTPEAVAKAGIPLENLFFLIEELLGTGLDCKMAPDSLCLQTIDLDLPVRTILQNSQRAREFFKRQEIEYCLMQQGMEHTLNGRRTMQVVLQHAMKNEAVMVSDLTLRSYLFQLPNLPRAHALREMCKGAMKRDAASITKVADQFSDYLITSQKEENLWKSFGRVAKGIPAMDFLRGMRSQIQKDLTGIDDQVSATFADRTDDLLARAMSLEGLPALVKTQVVERLDNEVEIVQEKEVELDLDKDLSINEELFQELNRYSEIGGTSGTYQEKEWDLLLPQDRLLPLKALLPGMSLVKSVFQKEYSAAGKEPVTTAIYADCFDDHLYMTTNFEYVYRQAIPMLHRDAKSVSFVLILQEQETCYFILVSKKDAVYFKTWIQKHLPLNAWLVNLEGVPEAETTPHDLNKKRTENKRFNHRIDNGLWAANFYQGNIRYLEDHPRVSVQNIKGKKALFGQYLSLKNAKRPSKLHVTFQSQLVDAQGFGMKKESGLLFSSRREQMKREYIEYQRFTREQVETIDPVLVTHLGPHQIPWLLTKEQVAHLYPFAVNSLVPSQIGLLKDDQVGCLTNPALLAVLPPLQVPLLDKDQVVHLRSAEQMHELPDKYLNAISPECVKHLDSSKIGLLRQPPLIAAIPPDRERMECVVEIQVPHLDKPEQIHKLSSKLLHALKPNQAKSLSETQVPLLDKEEMIAALTTDQIPWITPDQVFALTKEQVRAIPADRLEWVRKIPLPKVNWAAVHHVPLLAREQVEKIGEGVIDPLTQEDMESVELINAVSDEQFTWLKDEQLPLLVKRKLIEKIPIDKMSLVTKDQIPSLNKTQIQELAANQLQSLVPPQVPDLKESQFALLTKDDLIAAIPPEKVKEHVIASQVSKLIPAQFAHLPDDLINDLVPRQIPDLPADKIPLLKKQELINALLPGQIASISADQVTKLSDPKQIEAIPIDRPDLLAKLDQIQIASLSPAQIPKLTDQQIKLIPDHLTRLIQVIPIDKIPQIRAAHVQHLTGAQIKAIPDHEAALIQAVPTNKIAEIRPEHVPHLTNAQIKAIPDHNATLIQAVPTQRIAEIRREHVPHLTGVQIKAIPDNDMALIQAIPTQRIAEIRPEHVPHLTGVQIKAIPDNDIALIQAVPAQKIAEIRPEHVPHLTGAQIKTIPDHDVSLIEAIPDKMISNIRAKHVAHLKDNQIKAIEDFAIRLIQAIPIAKIGSIRPGQVAQLTEQQVRALPQDSALIKKIPPWSISKVLPLHVPYFDEEQVGLIPETAVHLIQEVPTDKVGSLGPGHIPHLNPAEQIKGIPSDRPDLIQEIPLANMDHVLPDHVPLLTDDQIAAIPSDRPDLIERIPTDKLQYAAAIQVPNFTPAQIASCPNAMLNDLLPCQVGDVPDDKIGLLIDPELIRAIPSNKVAYVKSAQIKDLEDEQLAYLPDDAALLACVPEMRRQYLTDAQLKALYAPKNGREHAMNIAKGVTRSFVAIGIQLPFWMLMNFVWLVILTIRCLADSSLSMKNARDRQLKETFVNTPMKKIINVQMIYDYPGYKRNSWRWDPPLAAPAA